MVLIKMTDTQLQALIETALRCRCMGDLEGSVRACRQVLSLCPDNAPALDCLGVAAYRAGNLAQAEALIRRAIEIDPQNAAYHKDMGNVYKGMGKMEAAEKSLRRSLYLLPDNALTHYDLGIVYQIGGRKKLALASYHAAVRCDPQYAPAWNNMGLVHLSLGNRTAAVGCFETAILEKPDFAGAYNNLGTLYQAENDFQRAVDCYQKSIDIDPDEAATYSCLGCVCQLMRKPAKAVEFYLHATKLQPDNANHRINLGTAYQDQNDLKKAIECYRSALLINPTIPQAYLNLGLVEKERGRHSEALACLKKAVTLDPHYENALNHLVSHLIGQCEWDSAEKYGKRLDRMTRQSLDASKKPTENPFLNLIRHADPVLNYHVAREWSRELEENCIAPPQPFSHNRSNHRSGRIKIGYLSCNFRNHPTADLTLGLFECHDRRRFSINCYTYGQDDDSLQRKAIRAASDDFRDISDLEDFSAAALINDDKVDILVDLMGYTKGARLGVCALRPAPIQVRMLGLAGTTGASFFDYLITDRVVTPERHQPYYSENFVYMPDSYQINNYGRDSVMTPDNVQSSHGHGPFIFACFCTAYKIEREVFEAWMRILLRVPESELWLMPESARVKQNLRHVAQSMGVNPQRLMFLEKLGKRKHIQRLAQVDLALDTRTVNGAATTSDCLWAGVPVLTLRGLHFASRMSSSLLYTMGLPELVASSLDDYVSTAVKLARTPRLMEEIKSTLKQNRCSGPLFDTKRFLTYLEAAYRRMWECHHEGGNAVPISMTR